METLRFRFKRTEPLRLISHLDMQRIFGRAFRRAGLPLAYSQGFNPHPKLAFAGALPFGMITDDEYGDVVLDSKESPETFIEKLNAALPTGLEILSAEVISNRVPSLSVSLEGVDYLVHCFYKGTAEKETIEKSIAELIRSESIIIQKRNKKGKWVDTDIRPFIRSLALSEQFEDELVFALSVNFIEQKSVKPILVLAELAKRTGINLILDETVMLHKTKSRFEVF